MVEPVHTRVQFTVSHMGVTNWYGDLTGATGSLVLDPKNPASSKLEIALPVASVKTTNAALDEELRSPQWMDATGHPMIRFVSTRVVRNGPRAATVTGNLRIASPGMLPSADPLPHLKCSRPGFGGDRHEADQHGDA